MQFIERWLNQKFYYVEILKMVGNAMKLYLRRYFFVGDDMSKGFRICLHKIALKDTDRQPHDHPFHFLTIMLWGSYVDESFTVVDKGTNNQRLVTKKFDRLRIGSIRFRRNTHLHKLHIEMERTVWTLVIMWPKKFDTRGALWGFAQDDGTWVHWKDYLKGAPNADYVRKGDKL